eukprot:scaffold36545_cov36-Phaeocystis_antarctica.AAC.1
MSGGAPSQVRVAPLHSTPGSGWPAAPRSPPHAPPWPPPLAPHAPRATRSPAPRLGLGLGCKGQTARRLSAAPPPPPLRWLLRCRWLRAPPCAGRRAPLPRPAADPPRGAAGSAHWCTEARSCAAPLPSPPPPPTRPWPAEPPPGLGLEGEGWKARVEGWGETHPQHIRLKDGRRDGTQPLHRLPLVHA